MITRRTAELGIAAALAAGLMGGRASAASPGAKVKLAIYVRLEAKPGKEAELKAFIEGALPLAEQESTTPLWFALQFGPSTFGIFDAFADEAGRDAHLNGKIAAALMANADKLLASPPKIEKVDLLAAKVTV